MTESLIPDIPTADEAKKLSMKPSFLDNLFMEINSGIKMAIKHQEQSYTYRWKSTCTATHTQYYEVMDKVRDYYRERGYKFRYIPAYQSFTFVGNAYLIEWS